MESNKVIQSVFFFIGLVSPSLFAKEASPLIDFSVRQVQTAETEKFIFRAIVNQEKEFETLFVEKIEKGSLKKSGKVTAVWNSKNFPLSFEKKWHVTELNWGPAALTFKVESASGSLVKITDCSINAYDSEPKLNCR